MNMKRTHRETEPALRRKLGISVLLAATVLLLYAPCLRQPFFTVDDPVYLAENPHVRTGFSLANVRWAFTSTERSNYWHPLTWFSHMLDVELYGLKPWGHHLTSVLLHVANTVLLFWVLRLLF